MTSVSRSVLVCAALITARLWAQGVTPLDHLSQAERMLAAVPQESLKKDARKQLAELRTQFAGLVSSYRTNGDRFVPPAATPPTQDGKPEATSGAENWKEKFTDVEKDLATILANVSSPPSPEIRRQLEQFRLELELFFASALGITSETRAPQPPPGA
jgi:hypothetical protein